MTQTNHQSQPFVEAAQPLASPSHAKPRESSRKTAQVAHDLRSPLAALRWVASSTGGIADEPRSLIHDCVERISNICDSLLEDYRAGSVNAKATSKPLVAMILEIADLVVTEARLRWHCKAITSIQLNAGPHACRAACQLDGAQFARVLSNIINNAVEATLKGGLVTVDVSVAQGTVIIRVVDDGIGMSADALVRVGTPGYTAGKTQGHGLGMSHAHDFVQTYGGHLSITSGVGLGTTVTMTLPAAPGEMPVIKLR